MSKTRAQADSSNNFFKGHWPNLESIYGLPLSFSVNSLKIENEEMERPLSQAIKVTSLTILTLLAFVSAVPKRRYDQWNYHLTTPKWIMDLGGLPKAIFNDHVFFTGTYEYFSGIFRIFSSDDIFIQSATSAMTFFLVGVCSAYSLMTFTGAKFSLKNPNNKLFLFLGFFLLAVLAPWDRECLYSAKPDYLLIPMAIAAVGMASWILREPNLKDDNNSSSSYQALNAQISFSFGVLISGGVAIKITWIHFAGALFFGSCCFFILNRPGLRLDKVKFMLGIFLGVLLTLPLLRKNFIFFGDPLYPASTPGFLSEYRLSFVEVYWKNNSSPVRNLSQLFEFLVVLPKVLLWNYGFLLLALFLSTLKSVRKLQSIHFLMKAVVTLNRPGIFILIAYIALWPLFHRADIFSRFVVPIAAILVWEIASRALTLKRLYLAVFFLFFAQGDPHILVRQAFHSFADVKAYYEMTLENEILQVTTDIEASKLKSLESKNQPSVISSKVIILTNSTITYFFKDPAWFLCGYPLRVELEKRGLSWTAEEALGPFTEEMLIQIFKTLEVDYYVHLKDSYYCPRPEVFEFVKKYGKRVGSSEFLFKME